MPCLSMVFSARPMFLQNDYILRRNEWLFCLKLDFRMASQSSFDVTTGVDLQEVDNAVNQAQKEIAQRYDFKGSIATIEFSRATGILDLTAESEFRMQALFDVLQSKLIKR